MPLLNDPLFIFTDADTQSVQVQYQPPAASLTTNGDDNYYYDIYPNYYDRFGGYLSHSRKL